MDVIYRDENIIAIDKPAGLLVHRSPIDRHETRFALQLLRDQIGQRVYPVHRLDKPTSGVLLFALSGELASTLALQFAEHTVDKQYLAVVRGFAPAQGLIDHPITDKPDKIADRNRSQPRPPQEASTEYERLATVEIPIAVDRYPQTRYSLMSLKPKQGRKHQLRRHMKHLGYPIIGDAKYGKGVHNRFFVQQYHCDRLLLACMSMKINHPVTGHRVHLKASLDNRFTAIMKAFNWPFTT